jgi:hypothetical protein
MNFGVGTGVQVRMKELRAFGFAWYYYGGTARGRARR